jgi:hypothetical protein
VRQWVASSNEWRATTKWAGWRTALLLAILCFPGGLRAQDTGYISGTVTDASGAAVAGAKVVLTNAAGSLTRNSETNADGVYVIAGLPGGTYNISVTAAGFQKYSAQKIVLTVAQKARVDVQLTVGTVSQEVVVSGDNVAQVDTESAEIGSTVTGKQVDRLELNGRNFTQLVTLVPGVVNQTGVDEGAVGINGSVSYSVNGGRVEYNNWEIDGGENMDNGSNGTLNVYPNLEAIAEFKVLTSNYGAQYGRNGSGTVEVETKSGTQDFHGSAFYYGRNDFFNANSWENNSQGLQRSAYKKHDFGYTIGGPVFIPHHYNSDKKKTFFFWSEEWRREKVPGTNLGTIVQNVPSNAERQGNFNDVCPAYTGAVFAAATFPDCPYQPGSLDSSGNGTPFANNTVPITQTGQALLQIIPQANGITGVYAAGQAAGQPLPAYVSAQSFPMTWREELVRIDHNLTENQRLTFRYIHDSWKELYQGPLWSAFPSSFDNINTNFVGPGTSFVARLTSNSTPTLLNEFVASYTADHINLTAEGNVSIPSGGLDLVPLFANGLGGKLPAISVGATNGTVYGGGFSADTGYFPWKNANPTYTYRDNLTKIIGNHTLLVGAYFAAVQKNQMSSVDLQGQLSYAVSNPNSTGNPFADLLTGQVAGYTQTNKQLIFYDRYKIFEPYVQDDWRVTRKLTLNLGLRWSFFGRYQEKFNQEFGFSSSQFVAANAPQFFPFNDPNNSGLLVPGTGDRFNGFIQCGARGVSTGCMENKLVNPAPRFGFAFDPRGDGKTAIRGGYGIFFEHTNGNEANAESLQGSPTTTVFNGTVSNITGYANVGAGAQANPSPFSPISIPGKVQWPYVQQWNLNVQHELPSHLVLSVAYVGSKGTHLTAQRDLNQLHSVPASANPYPKGTFIQAQDCSNFVTDPNTGLPISTTISTGAVVTGQAAQNLFIACGNAAAPYYAPFQGFGAITRLDNSANSIYNALQVSARRTVGDLSFSLAYTYSHSIDDSSDRYDTLFVDSYNPKMTRANSNFDVRHNLALSYVYSLPFFKRGGWTHTLLGGWQASGITVVQSGLPLTIVNNTGFHDNAGVALGISGANGSFPDLVGDPYAVTDAQRATVAANGVPGKLYYNPAAFALPTGLTFGNVGRNSLRMPGRTNFDFGLFKRFAFKERYAFEFRWENFNLFNHTQFDGFNGGGKNAAGTGATSSLSCVDPVSGNGGAASCASSGFLVLNQAHLPRIMQFGLRFQF